MTVRHPVDVRANNSPEEADDPPVYRGRDYERMQLGFQYEDVRTAGAFDGDIADTLGGFLAIIMMPFTYSIANGIMFAMLFWVILKVCCGKIKEIHPVMWVAAALFIARLVTLAI